MTLKARNVCIIACLGEEKYSDKYESVNSNIREYWNLALFHDGNPIDLMDFYEIKAYGRIQNANRHVFMNGIVLANRLRKHGFNVDLINVYDLSSKQQKEKISNANSVIISTTFEFGNLANRLDSTTIDIRRTNPNVNIIIGGYGIYKLYKEGKRSENSMAKVKESTADTILISKNGVEQLVKLIKKENENTHKPAIVIDSGESTTELGDYDVSWLPDHLQNDHSSLITSYGCPYSCSFCSYKYLHDSMTYIPLEEVYRSIEEICSSKRSNPLKFLRIADECFNVPEERALKICNKLSKIENGFSWCCFSRGDKITKKFVESLKNSNCSMVSIGLESGSEKMQKIMNKNLDLSHVHNGIKLLKQNGIKVAVSIIVGFYGEDNDTIIETIGFLNEVKPDLVRINIWGPAPGEEKSHLSSLYNFSYQYGAWKHSTMDQKQACEKAKEIYLSDIDTVITPPFSSIFDQWPQFAAKGLSPEEIIQLNREYYISSISRIKKN